MSILCDSGLSVQWRICLSLTVLISLVFVGVIIATANMSRGPKPIIVSRHEWGARESKLRENMTLPVNSVVIHHTYIPGACHNKTECMSTMQAIQNLHMDTWGWNDVGYSFAIGGDIAFEGRGWRTVGAHAPGYNNHSIGIVFIGDYREKLPSEVMLSKAKALIEWGVVNQYIRTDYQLIGHRQVRNTECPGDALYRLIQSWSHWTHIPGHPLSASMYV